MRAATAARNGTGDGLHASGEKWYVGRAPTNDQFYRRPFSVPACHHIPAPRRVGPIILGAHKDHGRDGRQSITTARSLGSPALSARQMSKPIICVVQAWQQRTSRYSGGMLGTILIIILILLLIGALPRWGYSSGWGYYPTGGLGLILIIVIILLLMGRI